MELRVLQEKARHSISDTSRPTINVTLGPVNSGRGMGSGAWPEKSDAIILLSEVIVVLKPSI
jgi:hypothetical protein